MTARRGKGSDSGRADRLAAALRDNLKRRKAQAKGRAQAVNVEQRDTAGTTHKIAQDKPKG